MPLRPAPASLLLVLAACASGAPGASSAAPAPNGVAPAAAAARPGRPPCANQPPHPYFEFQVETPVRRDGRAPAGEPIPKGQRTHEYATQFVVTPAATIDSASFRVLDPARVITDAGGRRYEKVADTAVVAMAWRRISAQRFRAAEIRGCTVPQLVQQNLVLPVPAS